MKKTFRLAMSAILLCLLATPAFADRPVEGDFASKVKCENGVKKAGFKDPTTKNLTWYTFTEVSHAEDDLSWPDANGMSFDARETRKLELAHVLHVMRETNCDTQDNPAQQGTGLQQGTVNSTTNATKNAVTPNSYVAPSAPEQR